MAGVKPVSPMCPLAEDEDAQPARAMRNPITPTQKMIDDHNVSHLPYRDWCPACVRGRGKSIPHRKVVDKEEDQLPVISIDYGFFGAPGVDGATGVADHEMPVMIVFDRASKSIWSHVVPSKGIMHPWSTKALIDDLNKTGYKRVVIKCDQEPSIKAVAQAAKEGWEGEAIIENSPKGESQSNGEVERAVQSAHGLARTLKEAIEIQIKETLDPKSPTLAWLVEYAGVLLNLFHRGTQDGFTAFHRLKGRP